MPSAPKFSDQVLIVDDDPAFHRLVESVLQPVGVSCTFARSGEEALRLFERGRPRAVLIDGLLPQMPGDALALKLRETWPKGELPIIFISAFYRDLKSRQHLVKKVQVDQVLHKPITPEELKAALGRVPGLANSPPPEDDADLGFDIDLATSAELLTDFLSIAAERIHTMNDALTRLGTGPEDAAVAAIRTEAHRFRGTGTSFGLPDVTRLGGLIEDLVEGHKGKALPAPVKAKLSGLVAALELKLARAGASVPSPGTPMGSRPLRVILVDGSGDLALSTSEAAGKGLPVRLFADVPSAISGWAEEPADVIFVAGDNKPDHALKACDEFRAQGIGPVVVMSSDAGLSVRLDAQARGARGIIHRLPDVESLLRAAPLFAHPPRGLPVVAVSENRELLGRLAETLSGQGLSVTPCTEAHNIFEVLDTAHPSLVVIDTTLTEVNGISVLKAMRSDVRHAVHPVIALVKRDDRHGRKDAFDAGADGVETLPFEQDLFGAHARALVMRRVREVAGATNAGGVWAPTFHDSLASAVALARRGRCLSVAVFEADIPMGTTRLKVDAIVGALGAKLRQNFRESDGVANLGGARFAVLLHDASKPDALRLMDQQLARLNEQSPMSDPFPVPVRAGVASFPDDGADAETLLTRAVDALPPLG